MFVHAPSPPPMDDEGLGRALGYETCIDCGAAHARSAASAHRLEEAGVVRGRRILITSRQVNRK